ncbi:hypothetical protein [Adhaeribacter terreus]|uniref:Phosphoribosylpyrophosphate synthetase n=1 Tax=Adhaeribacter terreus TaxID=529703 RepID=A0ABW0ED88_9BACT
MQEKERMTSMVNVLESVKANGYVVDFRVTEQGELRALDHSETFLPADVQIVDFYRFEHDTNPGDMAILYVLETSNGLKGTISDAYGTYSDSITEDFMKQVEDLGKNLDKHTRD